MHDQLAKIALDLLTQVKVSADDNTIEAVRQVRNMLRGIATKQLLVAAPKAPKEKAP